MLIVAQQQRNLRLQWIALRFAGQAACVMVVAATVAISAIWFIGRPPATGFTTCPTAFFISSFVMIATGGMLGLSRYAENAVSRRARLRICLLCGAVFLGIQSYGLWCLSIEKPSTVNQFLIVSRILGTAHCLCCLMVMLLIAFGAARTLSDADVPDRSVLNVCAAFWYLLGFAWTFLLCSFAALL